MRRRSFASKTTAKFPGEIDERTQIARRSALAPPEGMRGVTICPIYLKNVCLLSTVNASCRYRKAKKLVVAPRVTFHIQFARRFVKVCEGEAFDSAEPGRP